MNTFVYSASQNAFWFSDSPSKPSDSVVVEMEIFNEYSVTPKDGKKRVAGSNGLPTWEDDIPPQPSDSELYDAELAEINNQYETDKAALASAYLNAGLFDGVTEEQKKADIYARLTTLNNKYDADIAALDEKYGG
ncbi:MULTISPECIES: hypothetical protein [Citrobacter]|uniref:hypothetical protein n=1 Tax=Citrobacter TaxID=544 RepID=UPI00197CDBB7|nr:MULTISPECIES: hypothetical protein [Citrobacter]MBN4811609.1 hypothetical protein [Citrobacter braakii]MBN4816866.1 hypothetical protein [Citrobacter braakii]MBN4854385.1 hypothetical protein [Citrobacter braakii]MBN4871923.1 hypothetical protein [Citrobacter braakii]MDM3310748.1 hypothetical protein [Citrobacter sp. Cb223]